MLILKVMAKRDSVSHYLLRRCQHLAPLKRVFKHSLLLLV